MIKNGKTANPIAGLLPFLPFKPVRNARKLLRLFETNINEFVFIKIFIKQITTIQ